MSCHSMYILVYILQTLREKILALIQDQHSESVDNKRKEIEKRDLSE